VPFLQESMGFIFIRQVIYEGKAVKGYVSITTKDIIGTEQDPLPRRNVIREIWEISSGLPPVVH